MAAPKHLLVAFCVLSGACSRSGGEWPPAEFTNSIGMEFVRVPAGDFVMGSSESQIREALAQDPGGKEELLADERPAHKVCLTRPFLIGRHEITVGQFRSFIEATNYKTDAEERGGAFLFDANPQSEWVDLIPTAGANWRNPGFKQADSHPVVCLSWNDAKKLVEWLNASDTRKPGEWAYRLPTEAEWEYTARGPKGFTYPWGKEWDGTRCNFADRSEGLRGSDKVTDDGFPRTSPVGSYKPMGDSPFGASDMAGNVAEWCEDWLGSYEIRDQENPQGAKTGIRRVLRGGSWFSVLSGCRSANRGAGIPGNRANCVGIRLVLAPEPQ